MAFVLFTALFIAIIFYKEDFNYYDDDQLTDFSFQGRMFPPWIMPDMGRFVPIWLQEFNILALITKSPAGFHSFAVTQLLVLVLVLFAVFKELKFFYRVLTVIAVMLVPSVVISFTGLMPCERNILFWLAILVFCIHSYSRTKAPIYFAGCLIATQFALYYITDRPLASIGITGLPPGGFSLTSLGTKIPSQVTVTGILYAPYAFFPCLTPNRFPTCGAFWIPCSGTLRP